MRRFCLFSHFDRDNAIADHVLVYLRALYANGYEIKCVSTAALGRQAVQRLRDCGVDVALRRNTGFDFGSWQHAWLDDPAIAEADEILLANDSVYGPITPLQSVLETARALGGDVVGMTDSYDIAWHLQSYFLLVQSKRAIQELLPQLFSRDFASMSKRELIESTEVGLGQLMRTQGYTAHALYPMRILDEGEYVRPRNPTHAYWRKLLELGYPFIKVELLRDNPTRADVRHWERLVKAAGTFDPAMIKKHLERVGTDDACRPPSLRTRFVGVGRGVLRASFRHSELHRRALRFVRGKTSRGDFCS